MPQASQSTRARATRWTDGLAVRQAVYMHNQKLYIIEETTPEGEPDAGLFQQSFGWIDENGRNIRYESLYHHAFPAPPRGDPPGDIRTEAN